MTFYPNNKKVLLSGKKIEDFSSVVLVGTLRAASDSISGIADLEADAARSVPTDRNKKYLRHLWMGNVF